MTIFVTEWTIPLKMWNKSGLLFCRNNAKMVRLYIGLVFFTFSLTMFFLHEFFLVHLKYNSSFIPGPIPPAL